MARGLAGGKAWPTPWATSYRPSLGAPWVSATSTTNPTADAAHGAQRHFVHASRLYEESFNLPANDY
ncbi:MAG: hypothetical protein IH876_16605 [Gemmatimonadetes bacterium]|nr:hypothetical protein [Gemmatimonadota bacterium]